MCQASQIIAGHVTLSARFQAAVTSNTFDNSFHSSLLASLPLPNTSGSRILFTLVKTP